MRQVTACFERATGVMERLSAELRRLLSRLHELEAVEVLLFVARSPGRHFSATQVGEALYLTSAEGELEKLTRLNLLDVKLGTDVLYCYAPRPELAPVVEELQREYGERRLVVLSAMRATSYVDSFADAFRFLGSRGAKKRGGDDG